METFDKGAVKTQADLVPTLLIPDSSEVKLCFLFKYVGLKKLMVDIKYYSVALKRGFFTLSF